jgi:hypothetical protein
VLNISECSPSPCLVITGQPGIGELSYVSIMLGLLTSQILRLGKSVWRRYALRMCCAQRKPVIWYSNDTCWLFVEEGVFRQPTTFDALCYKTVVWTLVDSVDILQARPRDLLRMARSISSFILRHQPPQDGKKKPVHDSGGLCDEPMVQGGNP